MAMVASDCPECQIVGFDLWTPCYADLPNTGPDFVQTDMKNLGYSDTLELISENSHETVPEYFDAHPDAYFDLITVDGDHSEKGAEEDLITVLSRLKIGGVLVFDDICHSNHPYLSDVWNRVVVEDTRFATWEFDEVGFGVALAVRKYA